MIEKGYNSDVAVRGFQYHIQTEDWGAEYGFIVTRVFRNGAVIKTFKTSYQQFDYRGPGDDRKILKSALREQHQQILDLLTADRV